MPLFPGRGIQRDRPLLDRVEDLPLWEPGQRHSNAAKRAMDRRRILTWFVAYRQGTADEAAIGLGMDRLAVRPRVTELGKTLLLRMTDLPRRPSGKGGTSAVWEVTEAGISELRRMQEGE